MAKVVDGSAQTVFAFLLIKEHGQFLGLESLVSDIAEDVELRVGQHGLRQSYHLAVGGIGGEDVCAHGSDILCQTHHQILTNGIDGRVGDLGKLLTEIIEEDLRTVANDGQWCVVAHGGHGFLPGCCHGNKGAVDVLLSKPKVDEAAFVVVDSIFHMPTALQILQLNTIGA